MKPVSFSKKSKKFHTDYFSEVFLSETIDSVKPGLPFSEIAKIMKKASQENIFKNQDDGRIYQ